MESANLSRRQFLKNIGETVTSGTLFFCLPQAFALDQAQDKTNTAFNELLMTLTAQQELSPSLVKFFYDNLMLGSEKEILQSLLNKISNRPLTTKLDDLIKVELQNDMKTGVLIKQIISMCYLGTANDKTVSAEAFRQGVAWRAFGTTAPGTCSGSNWQIKPELPTFNS